MHSGKREAEMIEKDKAKKGIVRLLKSYME